MKKSVLFLSLLFLSITTASAKIWYVGTWTGKPSEDILSDISTAYAIASANDSIWISEGEYAVPSITLSKSKVSMYGGFAGTENSIGERVKVSGGKAWEFVNAVVFTTSESQIFTGSGSNSIVVDGIIFDGKNTGYHRAMNLVTANTSTSHQISNCIIRNYLMNGDGAGMNIRCKAEISDCLITGNENTGNAGGGAYFDYAVTMYGCEITNNKSGNNGGGVQANGLQGVMNIYNCYFENNSATNSGGGIYATQLQIHDCIIVNNSAGSGGAIAFDARKVSSAWNLTVASNKATNANAGGGISFYENTSHTSASNVNLTVSNSIFWKNQGSEGQSLCFANVAGNTDTRNNALVQYCIVDKNDYSYVSFANNIIETDSATLFATDWVTFETAPTVDAGSVSVGKMPKTDYAGNTRIIGKSVDIGPYENQNGEAWIDPNIEVFDGMMETIRNIKESSINLSSLAAGYAGYTWNIDGVCNVATGSNGFFPDIDYSDTQGNAYNWKSIQHLDRLINIAYLYTMDGSPQKGDETLYTVISAGINAWMQNHPSACSNWWYNQIAEPQRLGTLLIQMRKGAQHLSEKTEESVLSRMYNTSLSGYPGTGNATTSSNITNVAEHCIYSALLSYDESRLITMFDDFIYPSVKISTGVTADGIKLDQSHIMHDRVLYIGGYGEELIKNITFFALFTEGTKYAMPADKTAILSDFVRNTWMKAVRGQYMLWDVTGRGISRINEMTKSSIYLERMKSIDPAHTDEYEAGIKRINNEVSADYEVKAMSRQHFIADHTLHIRPEYTFDINFVSTRTRRIEWGNGENKKALYLSDGCTNIVRRGDEYATIAGTWNWARIPGITCLQTPSQATLNSGSTTSVGGTSTFAGGVTDSLYSVTAYDYPTTRINLSAKKGWFMFDDEIVCLGNSINAASGYGDYDANTTLNQCNLNGKVWVSENGNSASEITEMGEHNYTEAPKWVLHDGIGYIFPDGGNVVVSNQTQTGNWYDINNNGTNAVVTRDVFSLWFNHGKNVTNGSYAYIIVPNKTQTEMESYYAAGNVEILANNDSVQAVYNKTLDMLGLIFYKAASFSGENMEIKANKGCAILLKRKTDHIEMHVADPAQSQTTVKVSTLVPSTETRWVNTSCSFVGTGDYKGASKAFTVPYSSDDLPEDPEEITTSMIYVKPASAGGSDETGDGKSWTTAYATPQKGLEMVENIGDTIAIMQGTYNITQSFNGVLTDIKIQGGYTGNGKERIVNPSNTVLEYVGSEVARVLSSYGTGLIFSGVTFQNLQPVNSQYGIFVNIGTSGSTLTLEDCIVKNFINKSGSYIRGIIRFNATSTLTVNRCQFINCQEQSTATYNAVITRNGGNATVILANSLIQGTSTKPFISGGASGTSTHTITNCTFINNTGGAGNKLSTNFTTTITNSIFYNSTLDGGGSLNHSCYNGSIGSFTTSNSTSFTDASDVFADQTNYYPVVGFAGIDAGNNAVVVGDKDVVGNSRITNSTIDIGAYENIPAPVGTAGSNVVSIGTAGASYSPYGAIVQMPVTVTSGSILNPINDVVFTGTSPDYTANITVYAPRTINFTATAANYEVTVHATNVTVTSPTLVDGKYSSSSSSIIYFTMNDGTENLSVTVDEMPVTPTLISGNDYSVELTGISGATTVEISATLKSYAVNLTKNEYIASVSGLSEGSQTKDHGTVIDNLTFTLAAGSHSPYVTINGAIVSATENAGTYSVPEFTITDATDITISAFAANVLPVTEDTYQRRNGNISGDYANLTYMESRGETAGYAAIPLLRFIPTDAMKTAGYNKATLKLVPQETFTVDYTVHQFPTDAYTSINVVPAVDYQVLMDAETVSETQNIANVANTPSSINVTDDYVLNSMPNEIMLSVVKVSNGTIHHFYSLENGNVDYVPVLVFEKDPSSGISLNGDEDSRIQIYPFEGKLRINNGEVGNGLQIFDMTGRKLYEEILKSESSVIDYRLKTGVYLVRTGNETVKVVVK